MQLLIYGDQSAALVDAELIKTLVKSTKQKGEMIDKWDKTTPQPSLALEDWDTWMADKEL